MLSDAECAKLALMVLYAEDQYLNDRQNLAPAPDPRLGSNWAIRGHLTALDALWRHGQTVAYGQDTCYGYLAEDTLRPGVFVVAIRGTAGVVEWMEDGQCIPMAHPVAGKVETGFYSIYQSFTYRAISSARAIPAAQGLAAAVGGGQVLVLGHSLGSTLATYLTFDLAGLLGGRVQMVAFASPRPGDATFAGAFESRVANYVVRNFERDLVPCVPAGPDYCALPRVVPIRVADAQAKIRLDIGCWHHLVVYCALLDYSLMDWTQVPQCDRDNASCIKGPSHESTHSASSPPRSS